MRIDDGFSTILDFSLAPTVKFWEKTVTPPGVQGGGANNITTMRNTRYRTQAPKKLVTLSEMTETVAYDPAVLDDIMDMIQVNQELTLTHPDGSTWVFWGWLDEFTPGENTEGEQPTATVKIIPSNMDDTLAEIAPVYAAAP